MRLFSNLHNVSRTIFCAVAAVVLLSLPSCTEDPELKVTPSVATLVFSADGQTATSGENPVEPVFTVETNQKGWTVGLSKPDSWLTLTETSGGFTLSAAENNTNEEKEAIIVTVKAGDASDITISVTQSAREETRMVHIFGTETINDIPSVKYWKNGKISTMISNASADQVVMSGNDIYVAGRDESTDSPAFWKNGTKTLLSGEGDYTYAKAIRVVGNDVYVAGLDCYSDGYFYVMCWKNGTVLSRTAVTRGLDIEIFDLAVNDDNVYISGSLISLDEEEYSAVYWHNGTAVELKDGTNSTVAYGVVSSGGDIYVSGVAIRGEGMVPVYWKNGTINIIGENKLYIWMTDMSVSNGNVYIAGFSETENDIPTAIYWRNNTMTKLSDDAIANAITVVENDVYVAGSTGSGPVYWKNGNMVRLTGTSGDVSIDGMYVE